MEITIVSAASQCNFLVSDDKGTEVPYSTNQRSDNFYNLFFFSKVQIWVLRVKKFLFFAVFSSKRIRVLSTGCIQRNSNKIA